jgi:hypothetical protein
MAGSRYSVRVDYHPMTVAGLAALGAAEPDFDVRWRLVSHLDIDAPVPKAYARLDSAP